MNLSSKILLIFIFSASSALKIYSQRPDTVVTRSGDQLKGQIKSMSKGVLVFETDYSDSDFQMDWTEIQSLKTEEKYRVLDNEGKILIGSLNYSEEEPDFLVIVTEKGWEYINFYSIAEIREVEEKFMDKLRLGINIGYSYTKASGSQQFSVRSNAGYVTDKWTLSSAINSFDNRIGEAVTSRSDASLQFRYVLKNNWFSLANLDWLSSDEQQIDLRTTAVAGFGNYLVRNHKMVFLIYTGAGYNNENFSNSEEDNLESMEAFIAGQYDLFGASDVDLLTGFIVYPSLTERNRIRAGYNVDLVWDLIYDFEAKLGFSLNYDSNPPNEAEKSDYVFSLTLGWSL